MLRQRYDVLATFPECRNTDLDDIQAVIQVLTEATIGYVSGQILVSGSDDANVHAHGTCPPTR